MIIAYILLAFVVIMLVVLLLIYISNNILKVKRYNIKNNKIPNEFNDFKIVQISDVHSKMFGENNSILINEIKKINPDIVVMTGDIIDDSTENVVEYVKNFEPIFKLYPTYYSIGNHERKLGYKKYKLYIDTLKEKGVNVIINGSVECKRNNSIIVISALKFRENMQPKVLTEKRKNKYISYMKAKLSNIDQNNYNVLLTHDPENFELYEKLKVDLIFSGHVHGGLIRLGKICLLSPRRKLFPKYGYGRHKINNTTLIVNSGMGNASIPIRMFNRPEIVLVVLKK